MPSVPMSSAAVASAAVSVASSPSPIIGQVVKTRLCWIRGAECATAARSSNFAKKLARLGASGSRDRRGLGDRDGRQR